jgi:hypothetical protein
VVAALLTIANLIAGGGAFAVLPTQTCCVPAICFKECISSFESADCESRPALDPLSPDRHEGMRSRRVATPVDGKLRRSTIESTTAQNITRSDHSLNRRKRFVAGTRRPQGLTLQILYCTWRA